MNLDNHRQITREGCSPTLDATQIDIVVNANLQEDDLQGLSSVHFDNCAFSEGAAKIRENRASIRQHSDRLSPSALTAFGRLLHTVQDFYAHSNWIELFQDRSPIPLWNIDVSTLPAGIHSGTWKEGNPKRCAATVPSHATMNKDKHSSPRGKTTVDHGPNRGKTLFDLAYDAALRATQAELKWFFSDVTCYRITVVTGDVDRAGTDANVFIVLHTPHGSSGRVYLDNISHDDFERGSTDVFTVAVPGSSGPIQRVTIGFSVEEHPGEKPGWFLETVQVDDLAIGYTGRFSCHRWLATDEGDHKTIVDLSPP